MIARKAKLTAAHSDILYGGYMGCGWRRWRDEVGIERVKILAMAWEEWDTTFGRVMRGAVAQMQKEHGRVPLVFSGAYDGSSERVSDTWLGQTWKWMSESKLSMRLRGLKALVCKADPMLHTAFTTARDKAESRAACRRFRVMRRWEKVVGNWRVRHVRAHAEKRASRAEWSLDELGNDAAEGVAGRG